MSDCPADNELVEQRIDRILTQYRESPNLKFMLRVYLRKVEEAIQSICNLPEYFDLETAVGDQLTLIGKRLGFPRCHCVCVVQSVLGVECEGVIPQYPLAGFCDTDSSWADCDIFSTGEVCIDDDELYRKFLMVRVYQARSLFEKSSLEECIQIFFGEQAMLLESGYGRIVVAPGRALTSAESSVLQIYPRVLPVAPGIEVFFHFGSLPVFGIGDGWLGFCEEWAPTGIDLIDESGNLIITEDNYLISTEPLTNGGEIMCEQDVNAYSCI